MTPPRILVVEDGALLAFDLSDTLQLANFEVVGPAASVAQALALIADPGCDAAVLDIHLDHETAEPIARELIARRLPFITLTGTLTSERPFIFRDAPSFAKPVSGDSLVRELHRCLASN